MSSDMMREITLEKTNFAESILALQDARLIAHANDAGDVFGFKGAKHDADVVTKVTRRCNGKQHVHNGAGRHQVVRCRMRGQNS